MKKLALTTILTALTVTGVSAIDIPRGIFRTSQLTEARTAAAEKEVAVAYLMFPENIKKS